MLSINDFEDDTEVISAAAERQTIFLRSFQVGKQSLLAEQLLNEISAARVCLLNAEQKAHYDQALQADQQSAPTPDPLPRQQITRTNTHPVSAPPPPGKETGGLQKG